MRTLAVAWLLTACLTAQVPAPAAAGLDRLQAWQLLRLTVAAEGLGDAGELIVESALPSARGGDPVWVLTGTLGGAPIRATVDAGRSRVLAIHRGIEELWRWPGVRLVAHRGASDEAPENTPAAWRRAAELGAHLVEVDVRQTRDGVLVCMHDATLDRTTDGSGAVAAQSLDGLAGLDAGSWFDPRFAGERVLTFDAACAEILALGMRPDVDFKAGDPERLVAVLEHHGLLDATLYCGDLELLQRTLALAPTLRARPSLRRPLRDLPRLIERIDPPLVDLRPYQTSAAMIRDLHLDGRQAFVSLLGSNDDPFALRLALDAGADYIQTDHLRTVGAALRASGMLWQPPGRAVAVDAAAGDDAPTPVDGVAPLVLTPFALLPPGPDRENSGIVRSRNWPDTYWMHNDSGDEPRIYAIRRDGTLHGASRYEDSPGTLLGGAINVDWEDIAVDAAGHVIVADFGNNPNARRDLCLYYIDEPQPSQGRASVKKRVFFRYPDQTAVPAPRDDFNYDAEALFTVGDTVYVLSKNRSDSFTKLYRLPSTAPGATHTLELLGRFDVRGRATGADATPDGRRLAVVTYDRIWLFETDAAGAARGAWFDVGGADVTVRWAPYVGAAQIEAVCFDGDERLLLACEESAALFAVELSALRAR